MGLVGERKALAAAVLAFYMIQYLVLALLQGPDLQPMCFGLAFVYGLAFFGLVAGYFWARWYAIGLGMFGLLTAGMGMWQVGAEYILIFMAATHFIVAAGLWGKGMAMGFDGRPDWRQRFHMDENATHKLGRAVIRLGISLPLIVVYALAPRPESTQAWMFAAFAAGLAGVGIWGVFRMRTWGLLAVGASALALGASALTPQLSAGCSGYAVNLSAIGLAASFVLLSTTALFVVPAARFLRR